MKQRERWRELYDSLKADIRDNVFKERLKNAGANAIYIRWQILKQIIVSINISLNKFVEKVKKAKYFSIPVDETTGIRTISQMTFYVRFVKQNKAHEAFLQFVPVTDLNR